MLRLEHEFHAVDYRNIKDLRRVSFAARAVYMELFCGECGTTHGVVQVRLAAIEDDSGIDRATILSALTELSAAGLIVNDEANKLVYHVGHALRHAYSIKLSSGWRKVCDGLPAGKVRDAFAQELAGMPYRLDTVSVPSGYGIGTVGIPSGVDSENSNGNSNGNENRNSVPNGTQPVATAPVTREVDERSQSVVDNATAANANGPRTAASLFDDHTPVSDQNRQPRAKRARTVAESPPSREATREIFEQAGSSWSEADQCYDHHLARGWVSGRTPLKDWSAACRTWIANAKKYASQRGSYRSSKPVYDESAVWTPEAKARAERESTGEF